MCLPCVRYGWFPQRVLCLCLLMSFELFVVMVLSLFESMVAACILGIHFLFFRLRLLA